MLHCTSFFRIAESASAEASEIRGRTPRIPHPHSPCRPGSQDSKRKAGNVDTLKTARRYLVIRDAKRQGERGTLEGRMTKGYGTAGEDYEQESAVRDCRGDESVWGWLRGGAGRRKLVLAMACTCAAAVGALAVHGEAAGIKRFELAVKLPAGEQKIVRKAQDASLQFASSDVTEASIKAQQAAKKQYEAMIASALKAEAQAHKLGEKASEMSLKAADDAEHRKLVKQQQRAMRCVYPLVLSPKGRGLEGLQERRP